MEKLYTKTDLRLMSKAAIKEFQKVMANNIWKEIIESKDSTGFKAGMSRAADMVEGAIFKIDVDIIDNNNR